MEPRGVSQLPAITTGLVSAVTFGPDGTLATDDDNGMIQPWNVADSARPQPIGQPLDSTTKITSMTFSADSALASGTTTGEPSYET